MTWIDENSLWLVIGSVVGIVVVAVIWMQTGSRSLPIGMVGLALIGIGAVVVEQMVVTDKEAIEATLHQIADAVETDDIDEVLKFAHSGAKLVQDEAKAELPKYEFDEVTIKSNLEITVDRELSPPRAVAEFNVVVVGGERSGAIQNQRVPRFVIVRFELEGDDWRVVDYEHFPPQEGMKNRDDAETPPS